MAQVIFAPAHDPREWTAHAPEAMDGQFINVQVRCGAGWCRNSSSGKEQRLWLPVTITSGTCTAARMHCAGSAVLVSKSYYRPHQNNCHPHLAPQRWVSMVTDSRLGFGLFEAMPHLCKPLA